MSVGILGTSKATVAGESEEGATSWLEKKKSSVLGAGGGKPAGLVPL